MIKSIIKKDFERIKPLMKIFGKVALIVSITMLSLFLIVLSSIQLRFLLWLWLFVWFIETPFCKGNII